MKNLKKTYNLIFERISSNLKPQLAKKHISVYVVLLLGVFFFIVYGLISLFYQNYNIAIAKLSTAIIFLIVLIYFQKSRNYKWTFSISMTMITSFFLYYVLAGGLERSEIIWILAYPLIAFFFFGNKKGLLFTIGFFIIINFALFSPLPIFHDSSERFLHIGYDKSYLLARYIGRLSHAISLLMSKSGSTPLKGDLGISFNRAENCLFDLSFLNINLKQEMNTYFNMFGKKQTLTSILEELDIVLNEIGFEVSVVVKEQEGQMLSVIHLEVVDIFTYQIKQSSFNSTSSTIM